MNWQFHPIVIPLFIGGMLMLLVAGMAARRRHMQGARPMMFLAVALSIYTFAYAGEIGSQSVNQVLTWLKFEYIGIVSLGPLFYLMVLSFTEKQYHLSPFNIALIFALPSITLLLAWTGEYHDWIWQDLRLVPIGGLMVAEFSAGFWYLLEGTYRLLLVTTSFFLLIRAYQRASDAIYRRQIATMLVGMSVPVAVYAFYISGVVNAVIDLNPFAGTVATLFLAWALFNQHLFDIAPIARETLLAGMRDAVVVTDTQGRVVEINDAMRMILPSQQSSIVGQDVNKVFMHWPALVHKLQQPDAIYAEVAILVDEEIRTYDLQITPLLDNVGILRGRLISLSDITARVAAENTIQDGYQRILRLHEIDTALSQKLDIRHIGDLTLSTAIDITEAPIAVLLQYVANELVVLATNVDDPALKVGTSIPINASFKTALKHKKVELISRETALFVKDMHYQLVVPLVSQDKPIALLILESPATHLFTERAIEMLRLLAARAAVAIDNADMYEERGRLTSEFEAFAHTVAHDLKNPLGSIISYTELMKLGSPHTDEWLSDLGKIQENAYRSVEIINTLLLFAKMRRTEAIELSPLDMPKLIEGTLSRLSYLIAQHHAKIVVQDNFPTALGFVSWVEEIWANYLSNAIKYGGDSPVITVGSDILPDGTLRFWVQDQGVGLTEAEQAKLFSPFTKLTSRRDSHGLGLSIVQRIVERLGGTVGVESVKGQGSLFYFTLPAVEDPEESVTSKFSTPTLT